MKRAFTVYREGSCKDKHADHPKHCCSAESPRGDVEDWTRTTSQRHSCARGHASHIWPCARSTFIIHVRPAFAATPCFAFILPNPVRPHSAHRRGGFRAGTKFCYALTSIAIHSQSVSQNLAQSRSSVRRNRPWVRRAGLSGTAQVHPGQTQVEL